MKKEETEKYLIRGILAWYPFTANRSALLVTGAFKAFNILAEELRYRNLKVDVNDINDIYDNASGDRYNYDYIIVALAIESSANISEEIRLLVSLLNEEGKLIILADNRMSIRYFTGEKDLFSGCVFDGIENYRFTNLDNVNGHSYSKAELEDALSNNRMKSRFYGVYPTLFNASVLFSENCSPQENLTNLIESYYRNPTTAFSDERYLYTSIQKTNMIVSLANGFFIECSKKDNLTDYDQIKLQSDRNLSYAHTTYVSNNIIQKRPMWSCESTFFSKTIENNRYLNGRNLLIENIENTDIGGTDNSSLLTLSKTNNGIIAIDYFCDLMKSDTEIFLSEFDKFINLLQQSSDHVKYSAIDWDKFDPNWDRRKDDDPKKNYWRELAFGNESDKKHIGPILEKGFVNLSLDNCIRVGEDFIFYNQDYYANELPLKSLIYKSIQLLYFTEHKLNRYIPITDLLNKYDLQKDEAVWAGILFNAIKCVENLEVRMMINKSHAIDYATMMENRMRMNYSQADYQRYFADIFKDVFNYKCYIFGSGKFAERFYELYGANLDIVGAIDNNSAKWGQKLQVSKMVSGIDIVETTEIEIIPPETLLSENESYKVFVCIKDYDAVLNQLKDMGVSNIAIYNPKIEYPLPRKMNFGISNATSVDGDSDIAKRKKYHVGYVAGVFDLFHRGHVNLLRRAKEQCDYLIVGVVSDEQVINNKKTSPYYCFEDRLEIVKSSKYVDEAVKIPFNRNTTEDAYRMYKFDAQFSGSDYENDPYWLANRDYLRRHGSDLVFFPYTESVSSTEIKGKISNKAPN